MKKVLHPAASRGTANFGWLQANYSFSFAHFFDPNRIQFGKLRVLNDDVVAPAMGFGTHPHQNMEIVTIPLSGTLRHVDSMGNEGVIESGDIQVMSAGSGVEHSEMNASTTSEVELFQIWVLPEEQNVAPRYAQKKINDLIIPNQISTVVKPKDKASNNELWMYQQAYLNIGKFTEDTQTTYTLQQNKNGAYLLVINGTVIVDNETLNSRDALGIWDTQNVSVSATEGSELLLLEVPMN